MTWCAYTQNRGFEMPRWSVDIIRKRAEHLGEVADSRLPIKGW
jgi:hypothetical protein